MKNIFAIIISLTIGQSSFGQKTPISYVNYEKDNDSIENPLIDWDDRISEITLETKKKFVSHDKWRIQSSYRKFSRSIKLTASATEKSTNRTRSYASEWILTWVLACPAHCPPSQLACQCDGLDCKN